MGRTLLLVEDDPDWMRHIATLARVEGYGVIERTGMIHAPGDILAPDQTLPTAAIIDYRIDPFVGLPIYRMCAELGIPAVICTSYGKGDIADHVESNGHDLPLPPIIVKGNDLALLTFLRSPYAAADVIEHEQAQGVI